MGFGHSERASLSWIIMLSKNYPNPCFWSHFSVLSPLLFFCLVLLLFLPYILFFCFRPILPTSFPLNLYFPKGRLFWVDLVFCFFERLGDEYFSWWSVQHMLLNGTGIYSLYAFIEYFWFAFVFSILFYKKKINLVLKSRSERSMVPASPNFICYFFARPIPKGLTFGIIIICMFYVDVMCMFCKALRWRCAVGGAIRLQ